MTSHSLRRTLLVLFPLLLPAIAPAQDTVCKHNELRTVAASTESVGHQDCGGISIMAPGVGVVANFDSCPSAVIFIPPYHEVLSRPGSNQTAIAIGHDTSLRIYHRCKPEHLLWFIPISSSCDPYDREVTGIYPRFRLDTCEVRKPRKD
ncbi:MAG: hypothetical protein AAF196_03420 [Planctomycetota bacterium]